MQQGKDHCDSDGGGMDSFLADPVAAGGSSSFSDAVGGVFEKAQFRRDGVCGEMRTENEEFHMRRKSGTIFSWFSDREPFSAEV